MKKELETDTQSIAQTYDAAYRIQKHINIMGTRVDPEYSQHTKTTLVEWLADTNSSEPLLEIGSGDGDLGTILTEQKNPQKWVAFDISTAGLATAEERFSDSMDIEPVAGSMTHLPFESETFGAAIAADSLEHSPNPKQTLKEIHRVLSKNGVLSVSVPVPHSLENWRYNLLQEKKFGLLVPAAVSVVVRKLFLGKAQFQPIDTDLSPEEWEQIIVDAGFIVEEKLVWPNKKNLKPLVTLIKAQKKSLNND